MRVRVLVGLAWLGLAVFLYFNTSFSAGGSDSSGYLNAARLYASGRITERLEPLARFGLENASAPVFTPLGFTAAAREGWIAPSYPPGLPVHMGIAGLLFGWKSAPFLVAPMAALACLWLMDRIGRELLLPEPLAALGAALLGLFPTFAAYSLQPMSDVPATAWALAAVLAALRARRRASLAVLAGAAFGIAVWVRPTNVLLVVPLLCALPARRRAFVRAVLGGLPLAVLLLAYNAAAFGSPWRTGYGAILGQVTLAHLAPNARILGGWLLVLGSPIPVLGYLALAGDGKVPWKDRALLWAWFGVFFLFYACYEPYRAWWYTRFLLPGIPALILATLLVARDLVLATPAAAASRVRRMALAFGVCVILGFETAKIARYGVLSAYRGELVYPLASRMAEAGLPGNAVVASMQMTGALRYYTGLTFARWDGIDPVGFAALRARVEAHGGRWYALVANWERESLERNLPGVWTPVGGVRDVSLLRLEAPDRPSNTAGAGVP